MLGMLAKVTGTIFGLTVISGTGFYLGYESCREQCPRCKSLSENLFKKKSEKEDN